MRYVYITSNRSGNLIAHSSLEEARGYVKARCGKCRSDNMITDEGGRLRGYTEFWKPEAVENPFDIDIKIERMVIN